MSTVRKVLVVDDDPVVGKSFDRVLSGHGYAVITAANGEEALKKLSAEDYDVVYTDIKMPGMNGLEVAERVRAKRPWTPVVIITGYGTQEHEARAKAAGVCNFLHKPLSPDMIESSARAALAETAAPEEVAAEPMVSPAPEAKESAFKNIALFFAAPFIGLAYIAVFPFVASFMLAAVAWQAAAGRYPLLAKVGEVAKFIGMMLIAPFAGLVYILLFPFIGIAVLAWTGGRILMNRIGS